MRSDFNQADLTLLRAIRQRDRAQKQCRPLPAISEEDELCLAVFCTYNFRV